MKLRIIVSLVVYGLIALVIGALGLMWCIAGGLSLLDLHGEMAGARQDFKAHLLIISGAGVVVVITLMFVASLFRR